MRRIGITQGQHFLQGRVAVTVPRIAEGPAANGSSAAITCAMFWIAVAR